MVDVLKEIRRRALSALVPAADHAAVSLARGQRRLARGTVRRARPDAVLQLSARDCRRDRGSGYRAGDLAKAACKRLAAEHNGGIVHRQRPEDIGERGFTPTILTKD